MAAVLAARWLFAGDPMVEWAAAVAGFAAIVGHNWSVFIRFTGGRGVATSAGALGALSPWTILVLAPIAFGLVMWRTRYVSLGSIIGACWRRSSPPASRWRGGRPRAGHRLCRRSGVLVTAAHADNIARLRAGTERKIGQKEAVRPMAEARSRSATRPGCMPVPRPRSCGPRRPSPPTSASPT